MASKNTSTTNSPLDNPDPAPVPPKHLSSSYSNDRPSAAPRASSDKTVQVTTGRNSTEIKNSGNEIV